MRTDPDREDMSQATKIVLGTVGLAVVLVLLLIGVAAFG
jgi:preprotein translocase subunit SecE